MEKSISMGSAAAPTAGADAKENAIIEKEKRFIIKQAPANLQDFKKTEILQIYPFIIGTLEIGVRKQDDKFFETIKVGAGTGKVMEWQLVTDDEKLLTESLAGDQARIEKTRYKVPHENSIVFVDIYHGRLEGLKIAEIKFGSEESAKNFRAPDWIGEEIADMNEYFRLLRLDAGQGIKSKT